MVQGFDLPSTCSFSSASISGVRTRALALLADLTGDSTLMSRVKAFYDHGLWALRDEVGWAIETVKPEDNPDSGETNSSGDILETALILGKRGHPEYYHDAERILRCHRFNHDVVGGTADSLCFACSHLSTAGDSGCRVNLLFDCETDLVRVESAYSGKGLKVTPKRPGPLPVRLPPWANAGEIGFDGPGGWGMGFACLVHLRIRFLCGARWVAIHRTVPIRKNKAGANSRRRMGRGPLGKSY